MPVKVARMQSGSAMRSQNGCNIPADPSQTYEIWYSLPLAVIFVTIQALCSFDLLPPFRSTGHRFCNRRALITLAIRSSLLDVMVLMIFTAFSTLLSLSLFNGMSKLPSNFVLITAAILKTKKNQTQRHKCEILIILWQNFDSPVRRHCHK